jgi:hypothetical protein
MYMPIEFYLRITIPNMAANILGSRCAIALVFISLEAKVCLVYAIYLGVSIYQQSTNCYVWHSHGQPEHAMQSVLVSNRGRDSVKYKATYSL